MFSLKEMFGKEVKVTFERDYQIDSERHKEHFMLIVGKRGIIWPYSDNEVVLETTSRIGFKLLRLFKDKIALKKTTDEGIDLIIPLNLVRSTWRYIKPKKIKQLSEASKQALCSRLAEYRALKMKV